MTPYTGDIVAVSVLLVVLVAVLIWELLSISEAHRIQVRSRIRELQRWDREQQDEIDRRGYFLNILRDDIREAAMETASDVDDYIVYDHNGRESILTRRCF